ncbi:MAG: LicD family protein [Slackia sp.]|nr:LicD family protein [Slackia sp.]
MNDAEALKRLQETELDILLMIDGFCKEHGIAWFMDAGTALGAMRHGGFIPWDDDIDISMLRDDYDRFIEAARTGLPEGYSLQTFDNNEAFAGLFAKVYKEDTSFLTKETIEAGCEQGIFVDIFPYDVLAADASQRARQMKIARRWQSVSYLWHAKTITVPHKGALGAVERFACRIAHHIVHACVRRDSIERHFAESQRFEGPASDEYMLVSWPAMKPCKKKDHMYGDWRTIPAPEDRRTHLPEFLDFGDGSVWHAGGGAS